MKRKSLYLLLLSSATHTLAADAPGFRRDIAPILIKNCLACHGPDKASGSWRADTFARLSRDGGSGPALVPGKPLESTLYTLLVAGDAAVRMPKKADALAAADIERIRKWIADGAKFDGPDKTESLAALVGGADHPQSPQTYRATAPTTAIAFSGDGSQLLAAGYHEVTVWNAETGLLERRIGNAPQRIQGIVLSPDGRTLYVGGGTPGESGEAAAYDFASGKRLRVFGSLPDLVLDLALSPDGSHLAAAGADRTVHIWRTADGRRTLLAKQHADAVTCVSFSRCGKFLAAGSLDNMVKVFDPATAELKATYTSQKSKVHAVAFDPGSDELVSAGDDAKLHIWIPQRIAEFDGTAAQMEDRFKKNPPVRHLAGLTSPILRGTSAPGAFFSASADAKVREYDLAKAQIVREFVGLTDWACSVAVNPKTDRLAAAGFDGRVCIWNRADGKLVAAFTAAPGLADFPKR